LLKFSVEFSTIQKFNSLGNTLIISVDMFGHFSVDKERSENWKIRVKSTVELFIDRDGKINAQKKRIKNGTKPLDNDDLATN